MTYDGNDIFALSFVRQEAAQAFIRAAAQANIEGNAEDIATLQLLQEEIGRYLAGLLPRTTVAAPRVDWANVCTRPVLRVEEPRTRLPQGETA